MRLHRLAVRNFKAITEREITFPDQGVVVVVGRNEVGKSSMIEAFDVLLELKDASRASRITRAQPAGRDEPVWVEAEFSIGAHRVVYTKQWGRGASTTLRWVGGPWAGSTATGGQAHDAATALWQDIDLQLWKALRILQGNLDGPGKLADSRGLVAALNAQADGSGALDVHETGDLVARVRAEADTYWTSSRRKLATDKDRFRVDAEEAAAAWDRARRELVELTDLEERLADGVAELSSDERTVAQCQAALKTARSALDQVSRAQEAADQAAEEERTLRRDHEVRDSALQQRGRRIAAAADSARTAAALRAELTDAEQQWQPLADRATACRQAAGTTRIDHQEAVAAAERAESDVRHLRDCLRLADLTELLDRLDGLREQVARAEAPARTGLTERIIDDLDAAERAAEAAEHRLAAGSAHLSVRALGDEHEATLNGEALRLGQPWEGPVLEDTVIELGDRWRVAVSPARSAEQLHAEATGARQDFTDLLATHGVESVAQARRGLQQATEAQQARDRLGQERDDLLQRHGEEESLRNELAALAASTTQYLGTRPAGPALPADVREATRVSDAARTDSATATDRLQHATEALAEAEAAAHESRSRLDRLSGEVTQTERVAAEAAEELAGDRQRVSDEDLRAAVEEAGEKLASAVGRSEQANAVLRELNADLVRGDHASATTALSTAEKRVARRREEVSTLRGELAGRGRDRIQAEADRAHTRADATARSWEGVERHAQAALLLEQTVLAHQQRAQEKYVEPFRELVTQLGAATYGDPDFAVTFGPDLQVVDRTKDGIRLEVDQLSTGAKEQLGVLVRLAAAQLVDPDEAVPVMFDDALGHSDRSRLQRIGRALEIAGQHGQVVVFTCHTDRYDGVANAQLVNLD